MNLKGLIKMSVGLILVVVYLTIYESEWATLIRKGNIAELETVIGSAGSLLLFSFLLIVLQHTFTFIPIALLIAFNVTFFGFIYGLLWSLFSSLTGSILCFLISRYLLQSFVLKKIKPGIRERVEEHGFSYILISRLLVFIPSSLINMAAGASSIPIRIFLWATLIGNGIYITAFSIITYGISSIKTIEGILLACIAIISIVVIYFVMAKRKKVTAKAEGL